MAKILASALIALGIVTVCSPAYSDEEPIKVTNLYTFAYSQNLWATCVSFENESSQSIVAVQFSFDYIDAFDTIIQTNRGDRVGSFAPHILIEGATGPDQLPGPGIGGGNISQHAANCWYIPIAAGSLSKITAQVKKIRYADGSIWVNPGQPVVFSTQYMYSGNGVGRPHPDTLTCKAGLLTLTFTWPKAEALIEKNNKIVVNCYNRWLQENAPLPQPSPSPQPEPSG